MQFKNVANGVTSGRSMSSLQKTNFDEIKVSNLQERGIFTFQIVIVWEYVTIWALLDTHSMWAEFLSIATHASDKLFIIWKNHINGHEASPERNAHIHQLHGSIARQTCHRLLIVQHQMIRQLPSHSSKGLIMSTYLYQDSCNSQRQWTKLTLSCAENNWVVPKLMNWRLLSNEKDTARRSGTGDNSGQPPDAADIDKYTAARTAAQPRQLLDNYCGWTPSLV